jgi:hypothetical protein
MVIEEWKDEDYMDEDHKREPLAFLQHETQGQTTEATDYHKERQAHYYRYCAFAIQTMNRTSAFHDVDEYMLLTVRWSRTQRSCMREPGSVLKVQVQSVVQPLFELTNISLTEHHMTPCVDNLPTAVALSKVQSRNGDGVWTLSKRFETLRWSTTLLGAATNRQVATCLTLADP